jgi:hypothetical protein
VAVPTGSTVGSIVEVVARYPGATGFTASSSSAAAVTLTPRATSVGMDCSSSGHSDGSAAAHQSITCAITVTDLDDPADYTPAGMVTVADGNGDPTQSCTLGTLPKACSVVFSAGLPAGTFTMSASYPGDSTEFAASSGQDSIAVS